MFFKKQLSMTEKTNVYPKFLEGEHVMTVYQIFHVKYCSN